MENEAEKKYEVYSFETNVMMILCTFLQMVFAGWLLHIEKTDHGVQDLVLVKADTNYFCLDFNPIIIG